MTTEKCGENGIFTIKDKLSIKNIMIYDCFLFLNELDILEKRLEYLKDTVDAFVLVEATHTFSGKPKPLFFHENRERYSQYNIIHVVVNDLPNEEIGWSARYGRSGVHWDREFYNRHAIMRGFEKASDDDIVMISDVDEIPNKDYVRDYGDKVIGLHMTHFEFSLKTIQTHEPWVGTVILKLKVLRERGPNFFRFNRWRYFVLKEAGWHFSYFGGTKNACFKSQSFAHCNDPGVKERTPDYYKNVIKNNKSSDGIHDLTAVSDELLHKLPVIFHTLQ